MNGKQDIVLLLLTASEAVGRLAAAETLAAALGDTVAQAAGRGVQAIFGVLNPNNAQGSLEPVLEALCRDDRTIFILPAEMQLDLFRKRALADAVTCARRNHPRTNLFYDGVSPCHPLLLEALTHAVLQAAPPLRPDHPRTFSVLLAASGEGDPEVRADSYKLMRLVWEQVGARRGEIGFLRHDTPMLPLVLKALASGSRPTVVAAQSLWPDEHYQYTRTIVEDTGRRLAVDLPLTGPLADHPNILAWLRQRALDMWWQLRLKTQRPALQFSKTRTDIHRSDPMQHPKPITLTSERTP